MLLYHLDQEQTICLFILICLILENGIFFVRFFWKLFCLYLDSRPTTKNLFVRAPNDENRICGVMANVFVSSVVDRWFEPRSGQTKDYKIGICCFPSKHTSFRSKSKDWLTRNRDNMSEWDDISIRELLFQWASTIKIQLSVLV
jgi:hypothetical protein